MDERGNLRSDMETSRSRVAVRKRTELRLSDFQKMIEPLRAAADAARRHAVRMLRTRGRSKETLALHTKADKLETRIGGSAEAFGQDRCSVRGMTMSREIVGYEVDGRACCLACIMPEDRRDSAAIRILKEPVPIPIEHYSGDMEELLARCEAESINTDPMYYAETSDNVLVDRCDACGEVFMIEADMILKVISQDGVA